MQVQAPNDNLMQLLLAANGQLQRPSCPASVPGAPTLTGSPINAPAPGLLAPTPAGGCCDGAPLFQACLSQHSLGKIVHCKVFGKHVSTLCADTLVAGQLESFAGSAQAASVHCR